VRIGFHGANIFAVHDRKKLVRLAKVTAFRGERYSVLRLCRHSDVGMHIDHGKRRALDESFLRMKHAPRLVIGKC